MACEDAVAVAWSEEEMAARETTFGMLTGKKAVESLLKCEAQLKSARIPASVLSI